MEKSEETFSFSFFNFSFSFFDNSFGPVSPSSSPSSAGGPSSFVSCLGSADGGTACAGRVRDQHIIASRNRRYIYSLGSGTSSPSSSSSIASFFPLPFLPFLALVFEGPNSSSSRSSGSISAGFFGALISPLALAASVSDPSPGGGPSAKDTSASFFLSLFPPFFFWVAFIVDCAPRCRASYVRLDYRSRCKATDH